MDIGTQPDFFLFMFSLLYLISAGIFCWILVMSRNLRRNPVLLPFRILLLLFTLWSVCYSLFYLTSSMAAWIIIEKAAYPAYALVSVFLFIVAWQYTSGRDIFRFRWAPFLFVIPVITILAAWIPGLQSLLMTDFFIDSSGAVPVLEYTYGIWGLVHIISNVVYISGSVILLVKSLYTHPHHHRSGILLLIAGIVTYILWNMSYLSGLVPLWIFYLPISLLLIGVFIALAVFRYNLLDFLPMARTLVLDTITDLFLILSVDNFVLDLNPSMADAFDIDPVSSLGRPVSDVFSFHPEILRFCEGHNGDRTHHFCERSGTIQHYDVKRSVIRDEDGEVLGTVLIFHDITDLTLAQEKLAESVAGLQSVNARLMEEVKERETAEQALSVANRKLTMLSAITRHDILNSLSALKGFLELSCEERSRESSEYMKICSELTEVIGNQITFTRIYDGIGFDLPVWQSLSGIISRVPAEFPGHTLSIHPDVDGLEIYADPLFEKVIFTLVDNTIRHGKKATDIRFSAENGDSLVIVYEDNGVGIAAGEKEMVFYHGYGKNTGLGLFVARDILSITGLSIRETGEPGQGARFEIEVPAGSWRFSQPEDTCSE